MPYDEEDLADGGVGEPRVRDDSDKRESRVRANGYGSQAARHSSGAEYGRDPSSPAIDRPAHPRQQARSGSVNYDRYIEPLAVRSPIFSAERRRQRFRTVAIGLAIGALLLLLVIWVVLSRSAA